MRDVLGDATPADLAAAWRLAYAVSGSEQAASAAAEAAVAAQVSWLGPPSALELLGATYREIEAHAAPPAAPAEGLVGRWWELPSDQRAALWLQQAEELTSAMAAEVLALAPRAVAGLATSAQDHLLGAGIDGDCPDRPQLEAHLTGTLPGPDAAGLRRHLRTCPTCPDRLDAVGWLRDLVDPSTGPVPEAADAGRKALEASLSGDLSAAFEELAAPAPAPTPPVEDALLVDPAPVATVVEAPAEPETDVAAEPPPEPPSTQPGRPKPDRQLSVAAAALAAFNQALGQEVEEEPAGAEQPDVDEVDDVDADEEDADAAEPVPAEEPEPTAAASEAPTEQPAPVELSPEAPIEAVAALGAETPVGEEATSRRHWRPGGRRHHPRPADEAPVVPAVVDVEPATAVPDPTVAHVPGPLATGDAEPSATGGTEDDGDEYYGPDHPVVAGIGPGARLHTKRRAADRTKLGTRVLAGATATLVAAGIVGLVVTHKKGLPRLETVKVRSTPSTLFPTGASGPTVTTPSSNPLLVIPGAQVSTTLPGTSTSSTSSTSTSSTSTTAPSATGTTTPTRSSSGGSSSHTTTPTTAPHRSSPTTQPPTPTTAPKPTTTTTAPPKTTTTQSCVLFICG